MSTIAFDVDGTLVTYNDRPRWEIIELLRILKGLGNKIIVHSGGGKSYAELWVRRLYLDDFVDEVRDKSFVNPVGDDIDLAFDDDFGVFGKLTIKV